MKIQETTPNNDFQGRVFIKDRFWGNTAKQVQKAATQLREMNIIKDAKCDIILSKYGNHDIYVTAQKISDYSKKPTRFYRVVDRVTANNDTIIGSAKRLIPEYNQNVLPLIEQPKRYTPEIYYNKGAICVRAIPKPEKKNRFLPFLGTTRFMASNYNDYSRQVLKAIQKVSAEVEKSDADLFITSQKHIKKDGYLEIFMQKAQDYVAGEKPQSIYLAEQGNVKSIAQATKKAFEEYKENIKPKSEVSEPTLDKWQKKFKDFIKKII